MSPCLGLLLALVASSISSCRAHVVGVNPNHQPTPVYMKYPDVCVQGGTRMPYIQTENNCILACQQDDGCKAIDFHATLNQCWFHYDATACGQRLATPGCTHTQMTNMCIRTVDVANCFKLEFDGSVVSPPNVETRISNYHIRGGTLMKNYRDLQSCIDACYRDFWCSAVDFNDKFKTCWFHKSGTACNQKEAKQGCLHVKVKTGCESC